MKIRTIIFLLFITCLTNGINSSQNGIINDFHTHQILSINNNSLSAFPTFSDVCSDNNIPTYKESRKKDTPKNTTSKYNTLNTGAITLKNNNTIRLKFISLCSGLPPPIA